ncbi:hypothetical protein H0H81_000587 [Sphagnurus paluster]|uniref:Uncharacterized protein n=1 Tax=Sphagnurus paluster TaxID=117069 RepID=A0A9P7FWF0_9AGAR|nr:hypothetical protein H0H81_000587 [Sphagnurus paluster]
MGSKFSLSIPEDVVNIILDQFEDTPNDLQIRTFLACSTIARPFLAPSQARLFKKVILHSDGSKCNKCQRLYVLLTQSPHLALHIRVLVLDPAPQWFKLPDDPELPNWIFREEKLAPVLDIIPYLRAIHIRPEKYRLLYWRDLTGELEASFLRAFRSPYLKELEIKFLEVPATLFSFTTDLEDLSLTESGIDYESDTAMNFASKACEGVIQKPRLRSLSLTPGSSISLMENLRSAVDLSNLRELNFIGRLDRTTLKILEPLLRILHHFQWTVSDSDSPEDSHDWQSRRARGVSEANAPINWAVRALRDLQRRGKPVDLVAITVDVIFGDSYEDVTEWGWFWDDLDAILSDDKIFANLQHVTVVPFLQDDYSKKMQKLGEKYSTGMWRALPRIHSRGIFNING